MATPAWGSSMSCTVAPRSASVFRLSSKCVPDVVVHAAFQETPWHTDAKAAHVARQRAREIGHRDIGGGGVA